MKRRDVGRVLKQQGFVRESTPVRMVRWRRSAPGGDQFFALDNVFAGDWRVFLAVGTPPAVWPGESLDPSTTEWVEAESPWFHYFTDLDPNDPQDAQFDSKEQALERCLKWFLDVGLQWLLNPSAKSASEWRTRHNLLIRVNGGRIAG